MQKIRTALELSLAGAMFTAVILIACVFPNGFQM